MGGTLARGEDIRVLEWRGTRGNAGRHRDLHSHGEQRPPPAVPAQLEAPSEEEAGPLAMGPNEIPDEVPRMVVEPTEYLGRDYYKLDLARYRDIASVNPLFVSVRSYKGRTVRR